MAFYGLKAVQGLILTPSHTPIMIQVYIPMSENRAIRITDVLLNCIEWCAAKLWFN